jgi:hypothetical protein
VGASGEARSGNRLGRGIRKSNQYDDTKAEKDAGRGGGSDRDPAILADKGGNRLFDDRGADNPESAGNQNRNDRKTKVSRSIFEPEKQIRMRFG